MRERNLLSQTQKNLDLFSPAGIKEKEEGGTISLKDGKVKEANLCGPGKGAGGTHQGRFSGPCELWRLILTQSLCHAGYGTRSEKGTTEKRAKGSEGRGVTGSALVFISVTQVPRKNHRFMF